MVSEPRGPYAGSAQGAVLRATRAGPHVMRKALVTGIAGQDGAYLAGLLLEKGYHVHGTFRDGSASSFWRLNELGLCGHPALTLVEHDITDARATLELVKRAAPSEVYNLAAQSSVHLSFEKPDATLQTNSGGTLNLLEAICRVDQGIRFCQAGTAEMFGRVQTAPQHEGTPFHPTSPYGVAKLCAHWMTVTYREQRSLFGCSALLFNHESPLRGREFVTRKITEAAARIRLGHLDRLQIGNLDARRDWGFAAEYVEGMWRMLQAPHAGTYVLATGRTESVREFIRMAFAAVGMHLEFVGCGQDEIALDTSSGRRVVEVSPSLYRPTEPTPLVGDATLACQRLGWTPTTSLEDLCAMMVAADLRRNTGTRP